MGPACAVLPGRPPRPSGPRRRPGPLLRLGAAILAALLPLAAAGCAGAGSDAAERPRLVVLVVVDQLRADLVERYADLYTGGFRRLLDEGLAFTAASHAHAYTETAPGHATLATGVTPSRHGVVANTFYERTGDGVESLYSVEDPASPVLGHPELEGRSPVNLREPGLAEWIRDADPYARVLAISKKDRAAIALGGRAPDAHVYWVEEGEGRFVTSAWYRQALPSWVEAFNASRDGGMADLFDDSVWTSGVPEEARSRSRPDTFPLEGRRGFTYFPHRAWRELGDPTPTRVRGWIAETPVPDRAVAGLARRGVTALGLGRREGGTDYLGLSFSAVDYVGHDYGPFSREQLDNLLRLDRELGELFRLLDAEVGEGRWVVALSADHGVLEYPEARAERGLPGHRLTADEERPLRAALRQAAEAPDPLAAYRAVVDASPYLAAAYPDAALAPAAEGASGAREPDGEPADSFVALYRNSRAPGRWPTFRGTTGVEIRRAEGVLSGHDDGGTTHGSPYWYDRWVPLYLAGPGVEPGATGVPAFTYDVAPTLAALAGVPAPGGLDGRPLITTRRETR